jgi:hypothetical protein
VPRFALIRQPGQEATLVPETSLPAEADLHAALTEHPELIPGEDIGLGRLAVLGSESRMGTGRADLVLVDENGMLCLVEVKKEGNPDTRRVVAQLIDYAAALWGASLDEFERTIVGPYLAERAKQADPGPVSLADYLSERFAADPGDIEEGGDPGSTDRLLTTLEGALRSGQFRLVVAAPELPPSVRRALEYLNGQGMRLYGVEVSYFSGPAECFVPRVVVKPPASAAAGGADAVAAPLDRESLLARVPENARSFAAELLDACVEAGTEVRWNVRGPSFYVTRGTETRAVAYLTANVVGAYLIATGSFPPEPYTRAKERLEELALGSTTPAGWEHSIPLARLAADSQASVREVIVTLCAALAKQVLYAPLEEAAQIPLVRNDFNIWAANVPALAPYKGKHLRGTLRRESDGAERAVTLVATTGGEPAWVPRFSDRTVRDEIWPVGASGDDYVVTIQEVAQGE